MKGSSGVTFREVGTNAGVGGGRNTPVITTGIGVSSGSSRRWTPGLGSLGLDTRRDGGCSGDWGFGCTGRRGHERKPFARHRASGG